MSDASSSLKEDKDKHRRNEEDPRVLELFCQLCFQYLGVIHCTQCHENFETPAAMSVHKSLKTGGCHFPGNRGLATDNQHWLNDVGSVQWSTWYIPKKEEKNRSREEDL